MQLSSACSINVSAVLQFFAIALDDFEMSEVKVLTSSVHSTNLVAKSITCGSDPRHSFP